MIRVLTSVTLLMLTAPCGADEPTTVEKLLGRRIIADELPLLEVQAYVETRIPPMPEVQTVAEWEQYASQMRRETFDNVIYRGQAAGWRDAETQVQWLDEIAGGPGYHIKKLRYEALPGLWIPALLYEPDELDGKVPVVMNVNGHDGNGKAATYKQLRCINQAKRGMLALNVEWLGMGQLRGPGYAHYRMNQLDLCGTSGLAPFYLSMVRGLDLLLSLEHADPQRVAVAGLSGGGWQTIFISSLDERVTLANPVAGYSSLRTRVRYLSDIGDSEQAPADLALYTDYAQMTAMRAPRPTLLTYNAKDNCCFQADHALPPLVAAAQPIFELYSKDANLRTHVNHDPGDHNFQLDNRQQLYRMFADFFYAGRDDFDPQEIPSDDEVKTAEELQVELPEDNANFHSLAEKICADLPRNRAKPQNPAQAESFQRDRRRLLKQIVRAVDFEITAVPVATDQQQDLRAAYFWFRLGNAWTVPGVELSTSTGGPTAILVTDLGRAGAAGRAQELIESGHRVLAVDPFYFGESKLASRDYLFGIMLSSAGDRPLGLQASQLTAIARWTREAGDGQPVKVVADGPRSSLFALVAAALSPEHIGQLELHGSLGSLKQVIEDDRGANDAPEQFCFGLLEQFDVAEIAALVAPRPLVFANPSERVQRELAGMKDWYSLLGSDFDPLP